MQDDIPNLQELDTFLISLRGSMVRCSSLEDAIAVKTADDILSDQSTCPMAELERLASVLARYGRNEEAEILNNHGGRLRTALYLKRAVAYDARLSLD